MAPQQPQAPHHHRSTTKVSHKPFKTKHLSKGALKEKSKGKVESLMRGLKRSHQQCVLSKLDRRNQSKQKRLATHSEHHKTNSVFNGASAAPRITAVIPLCPDLSLSDVMKRLVESVDVDSAAPTAATDWQINVARFKQKIRFIAPSRTDLWEALDACRVADFVLFVLSADQEVDALGEQMLRCIESQGVSNVLTVVQNLSSAGVAKKQHQVQDSLKSYITHFFATQEKVHSLDSRQECINVMRSLCTTTPKGVRWREDRSWMLVEDTQWTCDSLKVTGVVRGRGLNPNRLVQVGDLGDFRIQKIQEHAPARLLKAHGDKTGMAIDVDAQGDVLFAVLPDDAHDDLTELAPEEVVMQDRPAPSVAASDRKGVLLDDHHYFEDDDAKATLPKRLPKGTSKSQAAWYLNDDISDSGSDLESVNGDVDMRDEADMGERDHVMPDPTEGAPSEYPQSEVFLDPSPADEAEQLAAYRASKRKDEEGRDDREFPDEIELQPHALARERLAKYRGLKSLRSSKWDLEEDKTYEPEEWRRLLEIGNYKAARKRYVNEALVGGVAAGSRVDVSLDLAGHDVETLRLQAQPRAMFVLLRHEHKRTAANCSISLSSEYGAPLKSKDELMMQCGARRLVIRPLYSVLGNAANNVHKFDRYIHPGTHAVASFIGPVMWGSLPVLYMKKRARTDDGAGRSSDYELIGTGTTLAPSLDRIIAKRLVLTGHPYKIHRKLVTVRYMFFNDEDVEWFKALQLWTRRGRSGFIKESLGTHGYFKATFDGKINPQDSVAVSLYKRVWPRWAEEWRRG